MSSPASVMQNHKTTIVLSLMITGFIAALFIESSQPPLALLGEHHLDKVAHFLAFSCLTLLVCSLSFKRQPKPAIRLFSWPLLIAILIGITEESYQLQVPGRAADPLDLLADVSGALFAILLANYIARLSRNRSNIK